MYFGLFGKKKPHTSHDYGKKQTSVWQKGFKWVGEHAAGIKSAADGVGTVARWIGSGAGALAGGAAAIGLEPVAAGLGAVAIGAKGVQGLAHGVSKVAGAADAAWKTKLAGEAAIDSMRHGHIISGVKSAIEAEKQAMRVRKEIQRK